MGSSMSGGLGSPTRALVEDGGLEGTMVGLVAEGVGLERPVRLPLNAGTLGSGSYMDVRGGESGRLGLRGA